MDIDETCREGYTSLDSLRRADYLFWEETVAEKSKVTRISAKDKSPKKVVKAKVAAEPKGFFAKLKAYFVGAWFELKQVRWPDRKATWGLTVAVILFSAFFIALILLLDTLFGNIFELIIA